MRLSASILRPPVFTADTILVFCLLIVFVLVFVGRAFVRVFIFVGRQHFLISALIVPRATFVRTTELNTLSARTPSPVVPYTEIVSIWLPQRTFAAPRNAAV